MGFKKIHTLTPILANGEVAIKGAFACIDRASGSSQGQAVASQVAVDLIPIGRFREDKTGDGVATVEIELFEGKTIEWATNATGGVTVDATDILGPCYFTAPGTVGVPADPSTYSLAGRVWIVEGAGGARIGFEPADSIGLQGPPGA